MKIRAWRPADVPHIVSLVSGILQKEFPQDQAAYPAQDLTELEKSYPAPENTFLVAEIDAHVVGTCGIKAEDKKTAILRRLFVDPNHRGQGIGRGLLNEAIGICRKKGFEQVIIRTSTAMKQAIGLCQDVGFEEDGRWSLGPVVLIRYRFKL